MSSPAAQPISNSGKTYQPLPFKVDPKTTSKARGYSILVHLLKDQFSITTLFAVGAFLQFILLSTLKPSHAALPLIAYTIWTIITLSRAALFPAPSDPEVNYHRTTALLPSTTGEIRSGTAGEKIAVFHLGFKNYSPLGVAAPGLITIAQYAQAMMAELDSPEGRQKYGFLGQDGYLQSSSAVSTSASASVMNMYFRSLEGVYAFAQSEVHRKGWDWYVKEAERPGGRLKHLGILHELFEAEPGKWETVHYNMEAVGLGKAAAILKDGSMVRTLVDASKGQIANARGRLA